MSATVAAALKKIAAALVTNPKILKIIGGIVLGILIIIITPIAAVISIFNGDIDMNPDNFKQIVIENISVEEQTKLDNIENIMYGIESSMREAGYPDKIKDAQVLYILALSDCSDSSDFIPRLVGCFSKEQTDEQLISVINAAFGKNIEVKEFQKLMGNIRSTDINVSGYKNPETKNNEDLVQWAISAKDSGWGYVWGSHGDILDKEELSRLESVFGSHVTDFNDFIRQNWLGKRTADCVGLIKGYGWLDISSGKINVGTNGMQDVTADGMYYAATEKGMINTIPEIPGLAVWQNGHIGIYIGNGKVIEAMGTQYGVVQTELQNGSWTHWLKIPYISYITTEESG